MLLIRRLFVACLWALCFPFSTVWACGYDFVGSCSSSIGLSINGTPDSFLLASCEFDKELDGLVAGNLYALRLRSAHATTWESCINNVTNIWVYYRVYEKNTAGGTWKSVSMNADSSHLEGPYTTRYRSLYADINLLQGLTAGKEYIFETYLLADVDTLGDDFKPETTLLHNNSGRNYKMTFTYGGASAPPFTVLATKNIPTRCFGDSTGVAGVTVYGNTTGIMYNWSGPISNFHTLYNLPKGTYTVTVTGTSNHAQSVTISVGQPVPLAATFSDIEPAGCNNRAGSAKVTASGGYEPYYYQWSTGQTGPVSTIPTPGLWRVSVTDVRQCRKQFTVNVPGDNTSAMRNLNREICGGDSIVLYGKVFKDAGLHSFNIPNPAGCDTIVNLTLSVVRPSTLFTLLPDSALIICLSPSIDLCGVAQTGATYVWRRDGQTVGNNRCIQANQGGAYALTTTLQGTTKLCSATKSVLVRERFTPPTLAISSQSQSTCSPSDSIPITFWAITNAEMPTFEWTLNGRVISTQQSCSLKISPNRLLLEGLGILVRDRYGCRAERTNLSFMGVLPNYLAFANKVSNAASGPTKSDGAAVVEMKGGTPPYAYRWNNGATTPAITNLLPGEYCVTVRDAANCTVQTCVRVDYVSASEDVAVSSLQIFPNPLKLGQPLSVQLPSNQTAPIASMSLYDATGRECARFEGPSPSGATWVLPGHLPAGLFTLKVRTTDTYLVGKLRIEH